MTRIEIVVCLLLGVFCFMQISSAAPAVAADGNNNGVDEILMRLKQLRQQSEGSSNESRFQYSNVYPEEILRVHRTLDNLGGGYLLKRSMNIDPLGGGYLLKRAGNHQSGTFDSLGGGYLFSRLVKRSQFEPDHRAILYNYLQHALGSHGYENPKRNFDEIDRLSDIDKRYPYGLQNYYDLDKRFDEIDRMGSFTDF